MSTSMNWHIIGKLMVKDWQLFKLFVFIYVGLGALSAFIMTIQSSFAYYTGVVMMITVLLGASAHIVITTIVIEKKENQMSFIMGLPLSVTDYTLSKIFGGIAIYMACWLPIVAILIGFIWFSHMPNGMVPLVVIVSTEVLVATSLLLCVAIITGHEGITIVVMVLFNLLFNLFLNTVVQIPEINQSIEGDTAVFNSTALSIIGMEIAIFLLALMFTTYYKSRQACFL